MWIYLSGSGSQMNHAWVYINPHDLRPFPDDDLGNVQVYGSRVMWRKLARQQHCMFQLYIIIAQHGSLCIFCFFMPIILFLFLFSNSGSPISQAFAKSRSLHFTNMRGLDGSSVSKMGSRVSKMVQKSGKGLGSLGLMYICFHF